MLRIFISLIFVLKCISCYKAVSLTSEEIKYLDGIKEILKGSQYLSNLEFEKKFESILCNQNKIVANETVNDQNKLFKRIPFKFEEDRKCLKWTEEDLEEPIQMHVNDDQEIIDINDNTAPDELVYILKAASPMGRPILYFMRKTDDLAYDNEPFIFHMDILKTDHDEWISELKLWNKLDASVKNSYKYLVVAFDGFTMVKRDIVVNVFKQEIDETTEEPEIEEHDVVNGLTLKKKINRPQFMIDRPENDTSNNFEEFKNENLKVIEFLKKQNQNDKVQSVENNSESDMEANSVKDDSSEQQSEQRDGSVSVSQQEDNNNTQPPIGIEENDQNFNATETTTNEPESNSGTTESNNFSETTDDYDTTEAATSEEPNYSEVESTTRYPTTVMEAIAFNNQQYKDSTGNDTVLENPIDENTNNYDSMRFNETTEEPFEPETTTLSVDIPEETTYEPETTTEEETTEETSTEETSTEEASTEETTNEPEITRIIPSQQFRNYLLEPIIESNNQFEREYSMMQRMKQEVEQRVMLEMQINEIMEQNRRLEFLRQQALMNLVTSTENSATNDTSIDDNQTIENELISADFNATTIISNSTIEKNDSFSENSTTSSSIVITTQPSSTPIPVNNSNASEENSPKLNEFQNLNNEILHLFNNVTSFLEDTFKVILSDNQNDNNKTNKTNENNQNFQTKINETTTETPKIIETITTPAISNSSNTTAIKIENDPAEAEHLMGVPDRNAVPFINPVSEADENAENCGFTINSSLSIILISVLMAYFNNLGY